MRTRQILMVLLVLLACGCGGSWRQVQAQTASGIAHAANAALPTLVERFSDEGVGAIKDVKAAGGTRAEAEAAVAAVEKRWEPIWKAWSVLRIAHGAWAAALEAGDSGIAAALAAVKEGYCGLEKVWPKSVPALPVVPLVCPAGSKP